MKGERKRVLLMGKVDVEEERGGVGGGGRRMEEVGGEEVGERRKQFI